MCFSNAPRVRKIPYPKGRKMPDGWQWGEKNQNARLNWQAIAEIRAIPKKAPNGTYEALAARFHVSARTIRNVRSGQVWTLKARGA